MKPISAPGLELPNFDAIERAPSSAPADGFGAELKSAVARVDQLQVDADTQAQKLGGGEGNLHETMLALEKADIAMKLAMKVRNKLVDAYNEVMRMSV